MDYIEAAREHIKKACDYAKARRPATDVIVALGQALADLHSIEKQLWALQEQVATAEQRKAGGWWRRIWRKA